jgi:hypothetical protein
VGVDGDHLRRRESSRSPEARIGIGFPARNGAYCLELDRGFAGATSFADPYCKLDHFAMARRLHDHWTSRADSLSPGDEYDLVDEFADLLDIRGWFEWVPDGG